VPKVHRFKWLSRSKVLGRRFVVSLRRSPPKSTLLIGAQYVGISKHENDILTGVRFPDYELTDQTATRRELSELQGTDPMIVVLSRRGFCPRTAARTKNLSSYTSGWKKAIADWSASARIPCPRRGPCSRARRTRDYGACACGGSTCSKKNCVTSYSSLWRHCRRWSLVIHYSRFNPAIFRMKALTNSLATFDSLSARETR
jgi:hypothetical protein